MSKILKRIREEIRRVMPAVIYFFLAFTLFKLTFGQWLAHLGVQATSFFGIIVSSLIVGKVMLIVDHLPLLNNAFSDKPLVYNTLWKTTVYSFASFLFRVAEHLIPLARKYGGIKAGWDQLLSEVVWPRFWTIQVWFFILFLIFVVNQRVVEHVGWERLRKLFFGK